MTEQYKTLVSSMEKMDRVADEANRGGKVGQADMAKMVTETVDAINAFVDAAEQAVPPPAALSFAE
jgi:hypothetical protein